MPSWHLARLALSVELLLFWRGGCARLVAPRASDDSRALAVLSGGPSAMPQGVAFGWFVGEAVLGSSAMEWGLTMERYGSYSAECGTFGGDRRFEPESDGCWGGGASYAATVLIADRCGPWGGWAEAWGSTGGRTRRSNVSGRRRKSD